jgi:hypothetical protein
MNKLFFSRNFTSVYKNILNLISIFIISLNFNYNKTFNFKIQLLFLFSLLAAILIRSNLITEELIYNILFNNNSIFLHFLIITLIYLSLIYVTILMIRLLMRIVYSYKNIYQFIIYYKEGVKDIKTIMIFYYIQNIFFISLSLFIIYNILNKLYYLLNQNISLLIFSLTSLVFMIILIYNLFLLIKDFKTIKLFSNRTINNKLLLLLLFIIIIDLCYIFIFPLVIFNLLNYDNLISFINNLDYFKTNNMSFKAYYMFPNGKGKEKELPSINITNNNQITTSNNKTNITIGSGNVINITNADLDKDNSKPSTSKLVDNNGVDSNKSEDDKLDNPTNIIKNNYFNFSLPTNYNFTNVNLTIPEFKHSRSLNNVSTKFFDLDRDTEFKNLFTTLETLKANKSENNLNKSNFNDDLIVNLKNYLENSIETINSSDCNKTSIETINRSECNKSSIVTKPDSEILPNNFVTYKVNKKLGNIPVINKDLLKPDIFEANINKNDKTKTGINVNFIPKNNFIVYDKTDKNFIDQNFNNLNNFYNNESMIKVIKSAEKSF